ncbi:hypothetical protein EsH8_VII_000883 [Colletotrichum jinshuiense]
MGPTKKQETGVDRPIVSKKRCGTCIDRKISCDRRLPRCSSCIRSNRICQGYGLRLSWPRDGDRKRSVVGQVVSRPGSFQQHGHGSKPLYMINATSWDIEVYHYLSMRRSAITSTPRYALSWSLSGISATEKDLFQFFQRSVSIKLSTFSNQPLGQVLLRVVSSGDTLSGGAAQRALVAVAALQRYGPGFRAEELKLSALRALAASATGALEVQTAAHHVAAMMALCMFEQNSDSPNQWLCYLRAARNIINSITVEQFCRDADAPVLLEWVYYHEILAQFSLRHSTQPSHKVACVSTLRNDVEPTYPSDVWSRNDKEASMIHVHRPLLFEQLFEPLHLLSEVVDAIRPFRDPTTHGFEYRAKMRRLKEKVERVAIPTSWIPAYHEAERAAAKAEVYRLSTLVYLNRATGQDFIQAPEMSVLVVKGLEMMEHIGTCERPLPLLILGCEARTDSERLRVLKLITDTENTNPDRGLTYIRNLLDALWTQDDLHTEEDPDSGYLEKLTAVFSSTKLLPHFG